MEAFTYRGDWYLPNDKGNSLSGELSFDAAKGSELELDGNFDRKFIGGLFNHKILLGKTSSGKDVTLYNCTQFHRSKKSNFNVQFIIVDGLFKEEEELKFNKVICNFNCLDEWLRISGFEINATEEGKVDLHYEQPESIMFTIDAKRKGAFHFGYSTPIINTVHEVIIKQEASLELDNSEELQPLKTTLADLTHFQHFLTLGCFSGVYPTSVQLFNYNFKDKDFPKSFKLYYKPRYLKILKPKKAHEFLFGYKDIDTSFEQIIQKWFELKEKIDPVTDLLLESFYNATFFNENRFLNLAQGLETFHRRFRNNFVKPKKEHNAMITEIIDRVGDNHKEWLEEKLNFSNEPSLHKRIEQIIHEVENSMTKKIIPDPGIFIKQVKNSRNYYTHYDKRLEKKALKGEDLFYLTEKLKILLTCAVLKEVGFNKQCESRVES